MGLIYFIVVTPIALLLKVFGKDVLSLKKLKVIHIGKIKKNIIVV